MPPHTHPTQATAHTIPPHGRSACHSRAASSCRLKMQILRLLAARRAPSNITTASSERRDAGEDDQGPFFDLDFSSCSVRASSSGSSGSDYDSDESCADLDFIISLQRTHSASPLKFCASEPPPARATSLQSQQHGARKRGVGTLRSLSFGARKAAPLYGRRSFARSSFSSGRSLRLFMDSPPRATEDKKQHDSEQSKRAPSRHVIRRCLAKISRRLRTATSPRADGLRKCRSASSAAPRPSSATERGDDSVVEKQDGIAGAIAHCKDSLHRASTSELDSPLLRSRSE
uniref:Uncharacterized protein n=1 Tax=Avena sativa TaxID=4498 RepID=A0ACD5TZP5_AVESA